MKTPSQKICDKNLQVSSQTIVINGENIDDSGVENIEDSQETEYYPVQMEYPKP